MTPTYIELGGKRKHSEKFGNICTKRKFNISSVIVGITNDDYKLVLYRMEEVTNQTCKKVDERHIELVSSIIDLLQMLCTVVKEFKVAVDQAPYSIVSHDQAGPS